MIKKIKWIRILIGAIVTFIAIVFIRLILSTYSYGFSKHEIFDRKFQYEFFRNEAKKLLKPQYCFTTRFDDSVFFYKYGEKADLVILKIRAFNANSISDITVDSVSIKLKDSEVSEYFSNCILSPTP